MDDLETAMRDVLVQLELTSNGRTVSWDSSGGGDPDYTLVDDRGRGRLVRGDAPHLTYRELWNLAGDGDESRRRVLEDARDELDSIRKSRANRVAVLETKAERDKRIVDEGRGFPARDVANAFRCGIKDVWRARDAIDLDVEYGQLQRNGRELTRAELKVEIWRLAGLDMSGRQIAAALCVTHSSVRYVLARPPAS